MPVVSSPRAQRADNCSTFVDILIAFLNLQLLQKTMDHLRILSNGCFQFFKSLNISACCFSDVNSKQTTPCANPDSPHYFCFDCARRNAETEIGKRRYIQISVLSQWLKLDLNWNAWIALDVRHPSLKLKYDDSSTSRLLKVLKTSALKIKSGMYVSNSTVTKIQAGIVGLVHCPFCNFAAIMDDPCDLIFECANPDCGVRSCRSCRVKSHAPISCTGKFLFF